jgi:5'-3' exonuclease
MTTALIDGDIVCFRCAVSAEAEPEEIAVLRVDKLIRDILYLTNAESYEFFLSGSGNFRKKIYPEYKANRKDKPRPIHLDACRKYVTDTWNAVLAHGCEADDLLGAKQTPDTIICTIDKDLLQIPGNHYNFVKQEFYNISESQGLRNFYEQLLKGDRTDNVPGVAGLGEKKAQRLLEGCETEQEMFDVCRSQYNNDDLMLTYGKCLWIWHKENDIWNPTELIGKESSSSEEEAPVNCTPATVAGASPSTEPTTTVNLGSL